MRSSSSKKVMDVVFVLLVSVSLSAGQMFRTQNTGWPFFRWGAGVGGDAAPTTRMTCSAVGMVGIQIALTLTPNTNNVGGWGGWGLRPRNSGLTGTLEIASTAAVGDYNLVFTRRSVVEAGICDSVGLGPLLKPQQNAGRFSHPWGSWGNTNTPRTGIIGSITLAANQATTINLSNLPFNNLASYAGRGFALCQDVTTAANGDMFCNDGGIAVCCKLGYDDRDAEIV